MEARLNNTVDDILAKNTEKVKLYNVNVSYFFFSSDVRKISTWLEPEKYEIFWYIKTNVFDIQVSMKDQLKGREGG